jgi:membrane peptidoglycan carboxypeptidase
MANNYKSTEKDKTKDLAGWKKKRKSVLWGMYMNGKISRQEYNTLAKEVEEAKAPTDVKMKEIVK